MGAMCERSSLGPGVVCDMSDVLFFLLVSRAIRWWISILWGDLRGPADKSALAAINRALRFTRKDIDPFGQDYFTLSSARGLLYPTLLLPILEASRSSWGEHTKSLKDRLVLHPSRWPIQPVRSSHLHGGLLTLHLVRRHHRHS